MFSSQGSSNITLGLICDAWDTWDSLALWLHAESPCFRRLAQACLNGGKKVPSIKRGQVLQSKHFSSFCLYHIFEQYLGQCPGVVWEGPTQNKHREARDFWHDIDLLYSETGENYSNILQPLEIVLRTKSKWRNIYLRILKKFSKKRRSLWHLNWYLSFSLPSQFS